MKKLSLMFISFFLLFFMNISFINAEDFDVQLTPSLYAGGYNISCNGTNNGSINLFISGGTAPYTYVWLDGPTVRNRSNLAAGYYRVVVTASNGLSVTREITLTQPDVFQVLLSPTEYEGGYHISENGGNNGIIIAEVLGGVPPYSYLWSNGGSTIDRITDLTAGPYSLTVHDATNCTTTASVTLIEPTAFQLVSIASPIVIGNYNIGCSLSGSINVNVAGGTPPYTFEWEHGPNTQNLNDITEAGDYAVLIRDKNGSEIRTNVTLTRAPEVSANATPFVFPNSKNTSCNTCTNGSISLTLTSGTPPYTYDWNNGATVKNPNNLGAGIYSVVITDASGCTTEKTVMLTAPEREDWNMNGNAGISANQFIGTTDATSLRFKANNSEILKLVPDSNGGYARFSKQISAESGITLDAGRMVKISYESNASGNSVYYGDNKSFVSTCTVPSFSGIKHVFSGSLVAWTPVAGSNTLKAGIVIGAEPWNGTGTIELQGTNELGTETNQLNINWYCGKNVGLCTNPLKPGKVSTGRQFEVGFPTTQLGVHVAANIKGSEQIGLRVETVTESGNIPAFNTRLISDDITTNLLSGKIENTIIGIDNELFSIKGDGETKIGDPSKPSLYVSPSYDAGNNAYVSGNVRIASLGNSNSQPNLVQADGDGELSKVSPGTLGLWQTNGTDVFRTSGNVGIGNNITPSSLLEVRGVASNSINTSLEVSQDDQKFLNCKRNTVSQGIKDILSFNGNGQLRIGCDGSSTPWRSTFFITPCIVDEHYVAGKVGIGTETPEALLQVGNGLASVNFGGCYSANSYYSTGYVGFNIAKDPQQQIWNIRTDNAHNGAALITSSNQGGIRFVTIPDNPTSTAAYTLSDDADVFDKIRMSINPDGTVQIGSQRPIGAHSNAKLSVDGKIVAKAIYVTEASEWADYVFSKDYKLMSIKELSQFISQNGHLPEVPTTQEVQRNGTNIGDTQVLLLKKIEELTLYILEQDKSIEDLKTKISKLKY